MSDSREEFFTLGMERYHDALMTLEAFEEEAKNRLLAVLKRRTWTLLVPSAPAKAGASVSDVEVYATIDGTFGTQKARLKVGFSWDQTALKGERGALRFGGFGGSSQFKIHLNAPSSSRPVMEDSQHLDWGDRCLFLLPSAQADLAGDFNKLLDEAERQVETELSRHANPKRTSPG